MFIKIAVLVELDEAALDSEYYPGKAEEISGLFRGALPTKYSESNIAIDELQHYLARDILDRHHGMPKSCIKSFDIISTKEVE